MTQILLSKLLFSEVECAGSWQSSRVDLRKKKSLSAPSVLQSQAHVPLNQFCERVEKIGCITRPQDELISAFFTLCEYIVLYSLVETFRSVFSFCDQRVTVCSD